MQGMKKKVKTKWFLGGFWLSVFHQGSSAGSLKQPFLAIVTAKMKIKHRGRGPERAQTAESPCRLKSTTWTMCHAYQIRQCNLIIQVGSSSDTRIIKYLNLVINTDIGMEIFQYYIMFGSFHKDTFRELTTDLISFT